MFDVWPGAGCPETVLSIRPLGGGSRPSIETPGHCTSCSAQLSSLQDLAIVNPFHHPDLSEVDILIFVVFQPSAYSTYFMSATHCADSLEFKIFIYLSFITQSNMT